MIFYLVHTPSGDVARGYEGMDATKIEAKILAEGNTFDRITLQQYEAFVVAHLSPILTPAQQLLQDRAGAISELNAGTSALLKCLRGVLLLVKDELNILRQRDVDRSADVAAATSLADLKVRWAARAALDPRTVQQAKAAVANQLDSGAAD